VGSLPRGARAHASPADAYPVTLEADHVAELQLPAAAAIDLAVDGHVAVDDRFLHISAGVQKPRELEELPEAYRLAADGDVVDRSRVHHPRIVFETTRSGPTARTKGPSHRLRRHEGLQRG
jgi:hypothetical protein